MIKRILVAALMIFIVPSASSDPQVPAQGATASPESADTVSVNSAPAQPADGTQAPVAADTPQTASASLEGDPNELICRRERETGSKFTTKICRTRAEIAARQERDQQIMRTGRKIVTGPHCALNTGDC